MAGRVSFGREGDAAPRTGSQKEGSRNLGIVSQMLPAVHFWQNQGLFPQQNSHLHRDTRAAALGVVAASPN